MTAQEMQDRYGFVIVGSFRKYEPGQIYTVPPGDSRHANMEAGILLVILRTLSRRELMSITRELCGVTEWRPPRGSFYYAATAE